MIRHALRPPPTFHDGHSKVTKVDCIYNIAKNNHVIKISCHQNFSLLIHKKMIAINKYLKV